MSDNVETLKPWTIKLISSRVITEITEAARTSTPKLTVGQIIERAWEHLKTDGHPAVVATDVQDASGVAGADDLDRLERAVAAAVKLADSPNVPEPFRVRANRRLLGALPKATKGTTKTKASMPPLLEGPSEA